MISINPFFKLRQGALHSLSLTFGQNLSVKSFCKCPSHLPWDVCPHQIYVTRQELIEHSCLFSYCFVFSMDLRKTMSSISLLCASCKLSQLREAFKKKTLKVRFLPKWGSPPPPSPPPARFGQVLVFFFPDRKMAKIMLFYSLQNMFCI